MAEDKQAFIWLNGALVRMGSARIDPNDRGVMLGDGLFETIRVIDGIAQYAELHLARLRQGAALLGIEVPFDDREILGGFSAILDANRLGRQAVLRLTLTRGPGPRGLALPAKARPTLMISASVLAVAPANISVVICRSTRRNEYSPLAGIKSLNGLDNIIARREAAMRGSDDAVLLNTHGDVAEASAANLFLLKSGNWLTPRIQDGALPGIFRALALAREAAFVAKITEADLAWAQSICLGNALGVRVVVTLDGRAVDIQPEAIAALRAVLHEGQA